MKTDEEWRSLLTPAEFEILRLRGTELPNTGEYVSHFTKAGHYACKACRLPLYPASAKFQSGCGWPAYNACYFSTALQGSHVSYVKDTSHGRTRLEIRCKRCESHLGHLFLGHKAEAESERHCVNSLSVRYVAEDSGVVDGEAEGKTKTTSAAPDNAEVRQLRSECLGKSIPPELLAELDDFKFAKDDPRNRPLTCGKGSDEGAASCAAAAPRKGNRGAALEQATVADNELLDDVGRAPLRADGDEVKVAKTLTALFPSEWSAVNERSINDREQIIPSKLHTFFRLQGFLKGAKDNVSPNSLQHPESDEGNIELTAENLLRYLVFADERKFALAGENGDFLLRVPPQSDSHVVEDTSSFCARPAVASLEDLHGSRRTGMVQERSGPEFYDLALSVKPSTIPGAGLGLFANRRFSQGEFVCVYFGEKVSFKEKIENKTRNLDYCLGGFGLYSVDAKNSTCAARYINHGDSAEKVNVRFKYKSSKLLKAIVVVVKPVEAGAEFLVDYGKGYWRARTCPTSSGAHKEVKAHLEQGATKGHAEEEKLIEPCR